MNGPETVSQCCRWEFWALCTDFATGPLKITFSGGWSQNHIQCGMVSKSHSVGGGLKITFSVWDGQAPQRTSFWVPLIRWAVR